MANPQPSDPHLRMAHAITEELMMRDFTKRHRNILDLILRLSWGCHKHEAVIPRLKHFEICGIPNTKIKGELDHLVNAQVIFWETNTNRFWFNKDYDQWRVSIVRGYSKRVLGELIHINLSSLQNGNNVPKTGSMLPKEEESSQQEKGTKFPLKELEHPLESPVPMPEGLSKESLIKKVIKDIPYAEIIGHLNLKANSNYKATTKGTRELIRARWMEEFTLEDFKSVIDKKVASWTNTDQEKYLRPITLFGTKFEGYVNEKTGPKPPDKPPTGPLGVQQSPGPGIRRSDM